MTARWPGLAPSLVVLAAVLATGVVPSVTERCPESCQCQSTSVVCRGGSLKQTLEKLPQYSYYVDISAAKFAFQLNHQHFNQCLAKSNIRELSLRHSQIRIIAENAFVELHSLRELNVSQNAIDSIDGTAFLNLQNLDRLDASDNRLFEVDSSIQNLRSLKYLNLAKNQIRKIRSGSFQTLGHLETLILDGNQLTSLQGYSFQGLGNLRHLSLKGCGLSHVPQDVFHITRKLQILHLQHNFIAAIPTPQELRNLAYLRQLCLDNNHITGLKDLQFGSIPIDTLSLSHNRISRVSVKAFKYFNAKVVDLSFNQIPWVFPKTFQPLAPEMTQLNLAGNPLTEIPTGVFQSLYRLETLNLSHCRIVSLPDGDFASLQKLNVLDLSVNKLTNLSWSLTNFMSSLGVVKIARNPWHCDCSIRALRDWLRSPENRQKMPCPNGEESPNCAHIRCSTPTTVTNLPLEELSEEQVALCESEKSNDGISVDTIVIIVSILVIVVCTSIALIVILWKKKCFKKFFKKRNAKSTKVPPYYPYNSDQVSCDLGSINESDRGFPLRAYMRALEAMNGQFYDITPSDTHTRSSERLYNGSDFAVETQSRTCSSLHSTVIVGRESAV